MPPIEVNRQNETKSGCHQQAHLRDPDGHDIRPYHAGVNRLDPPWKVA